MPIYTHEDLLNLNKTVKSILIWGPPFTGKTRSLWTLVAYLKANNLGKLVLVDLDYKCESLVMKCQKEGLLDYLIVIRLDTKANLDAKSGRVGMNPDYFEKFKTAINVYHNMVEFTTGKWKTNAIDPPGAIIIDSLSVFCDIAMQLILGTSGPNRGPHELNAPQTNAADDYGRAMAKILSTVQNIKTLPCITGWLAHAELRPTGVEGRIARLPLVIGKKLAPELAKEFNITFYSPPPLKDGDKEIYRWQTHGGENSVESAGITGRDDLPTYIPQDYRQIFN